MTAAGSTDSSKIVSVDAERCCQKIARSLSYRPEYLLLVIAVTIFVAEMFVMVVLHYLPDLTLIGRAITDAVILTLAVFPPLYLLVLVPMRMHITQRCQAEAEKDHLIKELQKALDEVKTLQGIVPICAWCKSVRDDNGYWQQVEVYMEARTDAAFSHGICPSCAAKVEL